MNQIQKLNRFTTLPYLLDLIYQRKLILTNPIKYWEDKNDVGAIQHYLDITKKKSIYAICLTYKSETIHHWNKFANGENGCCIEFNAPKLLSLVKNLNLKHNITDYKTIKNLKIENIDKSQLIFIKRHLFEAEKEYRIIATNNEEQKDTFEINIDLDLIRKITLSNKLPAIVFESIKTIILKIEPSFENIEINQSTLNENQIWIEQLKLIK